MNTTQKQKKKRRTEQMKICDKCGAENTPRARSCKICDSDRFAPSFVRKLRKVNRNFYVQITDSHPASESEKSRITLYKWWPGDRSSFNINTPDQWAEVKRIIDTELAPFLKWRSRKEITAELASISNDDPKAQKKLKSFISDDPALLTQLLKGIDLKKISDF